MIREWLDAEHQLAVLQAKHTLLLQSCREWRCAVMEWMAKEPREMTLHEIDRNHMGDIMVYDPLESLPDTNLEGGNYTVDKYDALEDENAALRKAVSELQKEVLGLVDQKWVKREDYDALRARVAELEAFTPTIEATNALPLGIRQYIHDLETRCDPSGELRELVLGRDTIQALSARVAELEATAERYRLLRVECELSLTDASTTAAEAHPRRPRGGGGGVMNRSKCSLLAGDECVPLRQALDRVAELEAWAPLAEAVIVAVDALMDEWDGEPEVAEDGGEEFSAARIVCKYEIADEVREMLSSCPPLGSVTACRHGEGK